MFTSLVSRSKYNKSWLSDSLDTSDVNKHEVEIGNDVFTLQLWFLKISLPAIINFKIRDIFVFWKGKSFLDGTF